MTDQASSDPRIAEWGECRTTIGRFDVYITDLRKYGFTFITGLLATTGFLTRTGSETFTPVVKLGVLFTTLALIVVLSFLDQQYRLLQRSATIRARILEHALNMDLTSAMAFYRQRNRFASNIFLVYFGLALSALTLGMFVIATPPVLLAGLLGGFGVSALLILLSGLSTLGAAVDWSVDAKVVTVGTPVRLSFTNLLSTVGGSSILFSIGWEVTGESSSGTTTAKGSFEPSLPYFRSFDWIWTTRGCKPGLYAIKCRWSIPGLNVDSLPTGWIFPHLVRTEDHDYTVTITRESSRQLSDHLKLKKKEKNRALADRSYTIIVQLVESPRSSPGSASRGLVVVGQPSS